MTDPLNFREARAIKKKDARLWTPLDCLKSIVRDLESGECRQVDVIYIAMARKDKDGSATGFPFYTAGGTAFELRGLLAQHLHDLCAEFNQPS